MRMLVKHIIMWFPILYVCFATFGNILQKNRRGHFNLTCCCYMLCTLTYSGYGSTLLFSLTPLLSPQHLHHRETASTGAKNPNQVCCYGAPLSRREVECAHEPSAGQGNHYQWTTSKGPVEERKHKKVSLVPHLSQLVCDCPFQPPTRQTFQGFLRIRLLLPAHTCELLVNSAMHCFPLTSFILWGLFSRDHNNNNIVTYRTDHKCRCYVYRASCWSSFAACAKHGQQDCTWLLCMTVSTLFYYTHSL